MSTRSLPLIQGPVIGRIQPPPSKSITIRAMAAAALAQGRSHLYGALDADDTQAMALVLRDLGVPVDSSSDPWLVDGGTMRRPDGPLDARESGLTARISLALAALVDGEVSVDGRGRLRERPMAPLLDAIGAQGVPVRSDDGHLPATVTGQGGLWGGEISVQTGVSTQFATALLLVAPTTRRPTVLRLEGDRGAAGYLEVTTRTMARFGATVTPSTTGFDVANTGYRPTDLQIEPDASAAVYPMVAAAITGGRVELIGVHRDAPQPDMAVADRLVAMGCTIERADHGVVLTGPAALAPIESDMSGAPDGALALAVACLFASGPSRLTGLGTLRHKESDRLRAMTEEMARLGADVQVEGDTLLVFPRSLHGDVIDPHGDHRVAMSLALVGLLVEGVAVAEPDVVRKTWPGYWEAMSILAHGI